MRTDLIKEHLLSNRVTVYNNNNAATVLAALISSFKDIFIDLGKTIDIPEKQWMPIKLKSGVLPKTLRVYPLD